MSRRAAGVRTSLGLVVALAGACSTDFDGTRRVPERASLGAEIYGAICDRVGASALTEDLAGRSYRRVCHPDLQGEYSDTVDVSVLPPVSGSAAIARTLAVAKLEALARRRAELVRALDATFPKESLLVPRGGGETIDSHEALSQFLRALIPLQEGNPVDPTTAEPLLPAATRATGRLFASLGGPGGDAFTRTADAARAAKAQAAFARLSGRQGYRPVRVVLGAVRPAVAYPELRALAQVLGPRLGPGGAMRDAFQDVLGMAESELSTSVVQPLPPPWALADPTRLQPTRPRTTPEVAAAALLAEHVAFATPGQDARYIVRRDVRGFALPASASPGAFGAPFADTDADGLADVDALGRFVGSSGALAPIDPPFVVPGWPRIEAPDSHGRALGGSGAPVYGYVDTSRTLLNALLRDLQPLLDPDSGDETLADLLSGAFLLYGDPVERQASWASGGSYSSFDAHASPLADLLHATGQVLADPKSDVALAVVEKLFVEHEALMARIIGAALRLREVSNQHPEARLSPQDVFWDDLLEVLVRVLKKPALFKDVVRAFKDPRVNTTLARAFSEYSKYTDMVTYDPNDLNGGTINLTVGGGSTQPPVSRPVDRATPDALLPDGTENRSGFHRILQMIHDMDGVNACNKQGAVIRLKLGALDLKWPLVGSYSECDLFVFRDIGLIYLDSVLDDVYSRNPPQAELPIGDATLNGIIGLLGGVISIDQAFQDSSNIDGLSLNPTPRAFHRLVYFGTTSGRFDSFFGGQMPDRDPFLGAGQRNALTNTFVSSLIEPLATSVCPPRMVAGLPVADCAADTSASFPSGRKGTPYDLLRVRDRGGIFLWEHFDFLNGVAPLAYAFDVHDESQLFLDLLQALYRHWPSEQHGAECEKTGTWYKDRPDYNPRYCAESGLSRYEPVLTELYEGDLLPAIGDLLTLIDTPGFVTDERNGGTPRHGLDVVLDLAEALLDPDYAAQGGVRDRSGQAATTWADGTTPKAQVTPIDLFARALRGIDQRLEGNPRHARWLSARSRLVDTFLAVEGTGSAARFVNPGTPKAIPVLVRVLREQLNANCPDRETSPTRCAWPIEALPQKTITTMEAAPFSAMMHLLDRIDQDAGARLVVQRLLAYLLAQASGNDAQRATLASVADLLQLLGDDTNLPPIYNALALAAAPATTQADGRPAPGAADRIFELVNALTREADASGAPADNAFDRHHVVDWMLRNLFTPMDTSDPESLTPIEVLIDVIAEVNRTDSGLPRETPLSAQDFSYVFGTLRDFFTGETRGLEQFYEIVRHRDGR
ncbi:MAG: hypothetical protein IT376_04955 [Polyangiaceae bacterium]|nr:hypothetical protein [Polyangiaceae bacterium]